MDAVEPTIQIKTPETRALRLAFSLVRLILTLAVPVLLTMISVRIVMTPLFLQIEYNRPGFPEDVYGFTTEERLQLAPYAVNYLVNNEELSYLADLTFPDSDRFLFNRDELRHMRDVQVVTRAAFALLAFGLPAILLLGIVLWRSGTKSREILRQGLFNGAVLTLSIIVFIIVFALTAWDMFFTAFHQLFFEEGTWRFAYSDSLIRLFPEQFWFDAAITIGAMTLLGAVIILAITRQRRR